MKLLAFDTSTAALSVALLDTDRPREDQLALAHDIVPQQHTHLILPTIESLLSSFSLTLSQLNAIAYGCGPGSFTGIRLASSVAQGLGFATQIPLIQVSSLAAMAQAVFLEHNCREILVAVDARTQQFYLGHYRATEGKTLQSVGEEQAFLADNFDGSSITASHQTVYGIGDGWSQYPNQLLKKLNFEPKVLPIYYPSAKGVLTIAMNKFEKKETIAPSDAIPTYLR